jgi:BASS family bile acid:Na+ symporter
VSVIRLLRNRNFILILAFVLGIALGKIANWTEQLTLPALALVMTVSTTQISSKALLPMRGLMRPMLLAVAFNYLLLGTVMLALAWWLMPDRELWTGFVILAAVPPAVAVIPFTYILEGDTTFSLVGTIGAYLAALVLTPAIALLFIGESFVQPLNLLIILVELIVVPLLLSRLLLFSPLARHIDRWRGTVVNWGFFIVIFTVVGLNREVFLGQPRVLALTSAIAVISTFGLGYLIELVLKRLGVDRPSRVSLALMGTLKNAGLAAGTTLALFSERASVPAAVVVVFYTLYLVWLSLRRERRRV